jgi:hypothetical protein
MSFPSSVVTSSDTASSAEKKQGLLPDLAWLAVHRLPVLACLRPLTQQALALHTLQGNTAHRQKQVLEFFKTVDWLPLTSLDFRSFKTLTPQALQALKQDLNAYYQKKQNQKQETQDKQQAYKQRVDAYFREQVSASDKALLESLRDYELELTGRDVNWQHHFRLKSFKRVDAFVAGTHELRLNWIHAFRQDVLTYKRNLEAMTQAGQYPYTTAPVLDFDSWCDQQGGETTPQQGQASGSGTAASSAYRRAADASRPAWPSGVLLAFSELELSANTSWEGVKKRFRQLTLKHHPDLPHGCEQTMKRLLSAYQLLEKHLKEKHLKT